MSIDSPASILFDTNGTELAVTGSTPIPSGTRGLLALGVDSSGIAQFLATDSSGKQIIIGDGVSGSIRVQGTVGGTPLVATLSGSNTVTGSVGIANWPTTQAVTGSIAVLNQISITTSGSLPVVVTSQPNITGSVNITNTLLNVTGSVGINGITFPSTQTITGSVAILNQIVVTTTGTLPTSIVGTANITGSVAVTGSVGIANAVLTVTGSVLSLPAGVQLVTGSVSILNQVSVTTSGSLPVAVVSLPNITGSVNITNQLLHVTGSVGVNGIAFPSTQTVTGSVTILNQVSITSSGTLPTSIVGVPMITGSVGVTGSVGIANWPAVQRITGSVGVDSITFPQSLAVTTTGSLAVAVQSMPNITGSVNITNTVLTVTGSTLSLPSGVQTITGSVGINSVVTVTGAVAVTSTGSLSVAVTNFPTSQTVTTTGSLAVAIQNMPNITGSVNITNTLLNVTGSVGVNGITFPSLQTVTGSVSITNQVSVTSTGSLAVAITGIDVISGALSTGFINTVSDGNSTTTPLTGSGIFLGSSVDLLGYASIAYSVFSDKDSAANGLVVQFSPNNIDWDDRVRNTYAADGSVSDLVIRPHDRYARVRYTNGNQAQTTFRLQTILCRIPTLGDSIGVDHAPNSGDDAMLVKAVITGKSSGGGGTYVDVKVNPAGSLLLGGGVTPSDAYANPTDALPSVAFNMGWNSVTGSWDRITVFGTNADGEPVATSGALNVCAHPRMFDGSTWNRQRGTVTNGLLVDVSRIQGGVSVYTTGTLQTTGSVGITNWPTSQIITTTGSLPVSITNWPATQTVTGSVGISEEVAVSVQDVNVTHTFNAVNSAVTLAMNGRQGIAIRVPPSNTHDGSIVIEYSMDDGSTWLGLAAYFAGDLQYTIDASKTTIIYPASWTAQGQTFVCDVPSGITHVRLRTNTWTSGAVAIVLSLTFAHTAFPYHRFEAQNHAAAPTTCAVLGGVNANDSNTVRFATVKEPNTPALLTDPALVVAINPSTTASVSVLGNVTVTSTGSLPVTGSLAVTNWPISQVVTGSVNITNSVLNVTGSVSTTLVGTMQVTGSVALTEPAQVVGTGAAGSPASGVVTVQGITNGTPIPISGSINASNPSVGLTGSTAPTSITAIGGVDALGNAQPFLVVEDGHIANAAKTLVGFVGEVNVWESDMGHQPLTVDTYGALNTRGQVMTDEGSFTDDFVGTLLSSSLSGLVTFTSGSTNVTGVGTSFLSQVNYYSFIKQGTDPDSLYAEVDNVDSDTQLTLAEPYAGSSATDVIAAESKWKSYIGAGGSITVTTSSVVLSTGGTSGARTGFHTIADYIPFLGLSTLWMNARRAAQEIFVGYFDDFAAPRYQAGFLFDGTTNTTVKCVSGVQSGSLYTQTTSVTIPAGKNSTQATTYRVVPWQGQVSFLIDGYQVAVHDQHIIPPYVDVKYGAYAVNSGSVSNTNVNIDSVTFESIDRFDARVYNTNPDLLQATVCGKTTTGIAFPIQVSTAGIVTVAGSGNFTVVQGTATNLRAQVVGPNTPGDTVANPTTAVPDQAFLQIWNATGNSWTRARGVNTNADSIAVTTGSTALAVGAHLLGYNPNTTSWDRARIINGNLQVDLTCSVATGSTAPRQAIALGAVDSANIIRGLTVTNESGSFWLRVQEPSVYLTGSGAPAYATLVGGSDGNRMRALKTTTDGTLRIDPIGTTPQPVTGTVAMLPIRANNQTTTSVSASIGAVTLLAANGNRLAASIYNDTNQDLYVKYGAGASLTPALWKVRITKSGGYFEFPQPVFTGLVSGVWAASGSGSALISEETP